MFLIRSLSRPRICQSAPIIPGMAGILPILQACPESDAYLTQNPAIHAKFDGTKVFTVDSKSNKPINVKTTVESTEILRKIVMVVP